MNLLELLYDTLHSDSGLAVTPTTISVRQLRQKLYKVRKSYAPEFNDITLTPDPRNPDTLFLVKKVKPDGTK